MGRGAGTGTGVARASARISVLIHVRGGRALGPWVQEPTRKETSTCNHLENVAECLGKTIVL